MEKTTEKLKYLKGFGNTFESEALEGALPLGKNSPQVCPYNLYAEQLSGSAFTSSRNKNLRSWTYRILPTVGHKKHEKLNDFPNFITDFEGKEEDFEITPDQIRWKPLPFPKDDQKIDFLHGITTYCGVGRPALKDGLGIHMYSCNTSMDKNTAFYSADGDILLVQQSGKLLITTEFGKLEVGEREIACLPRGIKFHVEVEGKSRGYFVEIYKGHFSLPELGPIGSNCLANARDFEHPVAWFEDRECDFTVISKYQGKFFKAAYNHSIFDVVAWHGNFLPYKYNLDLYNTIGSISYDHPDPSIFTVLTAPTDEAGTALCDFVIFPPRWLVAENTFRPPWYHKNTMSEFMGNICGVYDAKEYGFVPGSASLHSCMSGHGPEAAVFEKASTAELKPQKVGEGSLAFMFESTYIFKFPKFAITDEKLDLGYIDCWKDLKKYFNGKDK